MAISNSDEDGFFDALFCEDKNRAVVGRLVHTHQRSREVLECVCLYCLSRMLSERKVGYVFSLACASIGDSNLLG
jgi:hypothetical protein